MDELDLLKKDWNKDSTDYKSYSDTDLYKMVHNKSSSIVKTLLYISIGELGFWILLGIVPYLVSDKMQEQLKNNFENPLYVALTIFSYLVVLLFIYLLYKSYKSISSTDSAKELMESILKTRKVIKYYVLFNLSLIFISIPLSLYFEYLENPEFHEQILEASTSQMLVIYLVVVIFAVLILLIVWFFYRVIYGILLKRLNKNYDELKKLEL